MNTRDFYQSFADLKFWSLDAVAVAAQLELAITNADERAFFDEDVAERVRQSYQQKTDTYRIEALDSDIIKYIKSFINFVRSIRDIEPGIKQAYINHLESPLSSYNYTDVELYRIIWRAYKNSGQFKNLYEQFMAFKFYMVETGDLIMQLPLLGDKGKEVLASFTDAYNKSNLKDGVDIVQDSLSTRNKKQEQILKTHTVPVIEANQLLNVMSSFGLRTHMDALTERAAILNSKNKKYYVKASDTYVYPPSVNAADRKLMNAYNECSGTKTALKQAYAAYLEIARETLHKPADITWENLSEAGRLEFIKFNKAMLKANAHLETLEPYIKETPALFVIYSSDAKRIQEQIAALKTWNKSEATKSISLLEGAFHIDDLFNWVGEQVNSNLTEEEKITFYDDEKDIYTVQGEIAEDKQNLMLTYNISARMKKGYATIEVLRKDSFSWNYIKTAHGLLYDIGNMIKEYRQLKSPDFINQVREKLELDLGLLLTELSRLFHQSIKLAQKLELEQGLRTGLFMEQLQQVYGAFLSLQASNEELPPQYKLKIDAGLLAADLLQAIEDSATLKVNIERQHRAKHAFEVRCHLIHYNEKLQNPPFDMIDLMQIKAQLKSVDGHNASQYADYLQLIIEKLVGLDDLEAEIVEKEQAIKLVIGDNIENLDRYEDEAKIKSDLNISSQLSRIKPDLAILRELYRMRAELRTMLDNIDKHKESQEALDAIVIQKSEMRGIVTRVYNYLSTYFRYAPEIRYTMAEGLREDLKLGAITAEIPHYHALILQELTDVINLDPAGTPVISEDAVVDTELEPAPELPSHIDVANIAMQSQTSMLNHIVNSRKGFVVLQSEWLRHKFIEKATSYIHESQRKYLSKKRKANTGIYQMTETESIAVVNIKSVHNSMVRIEHTLEAINQLSSIPTDAMIDIATAVPKISSLLSELKLRLKELFTELRDLTEALTALRDCMKNNTFNIFERDLWIYINKMLTLVQEGVNYYYADAPESEQAALKVNLQKAILFSQQFSPESVIDQAEAENEANYLRQDMTQSLILILERTGQVPKTADGLYDLSGLEEGSVRKRIASFLNQKLESGVVYGPANFDPHADAKAIVQQAIKNAADITKQVMTAGHIVKNMPVNEGEEDRDSHLIVFLKLFVDQSGPIQKYKDGSYNISTLQDGSLQKSIAAFLNISDYLHSFMNSTVSLADGEHLVGFIKSIRDAVKIKYQVDQAGVVDIFNDALLQLNYDSQIVSNKLNELIVRALNYAQPKIIDAIAQARIAEVTLGMNDNALLSKLEKGLDLFIGLGEIFLDGKFNHLKKDFPYEAKTLEIAKSELVRLKELNRTTESRHHFLRNAIATLKLYVRDLSKKNPATLAASNVKDAVSDMSELESVAVDGIEASVVVPVQQSEVAGPRVLHVISDLNDPDDIIDDYSDLPVLESAEELAKLSVVHPVLQSVADTKDGVIPKFEGNVEAQRLAFRNYREYLAEVIKRKNLSEPAGVYGLDVPNKAPADVPVVQPVEPPAVEIDVNESLKLEADVDTLREACCIYKHHLAMEINRLREEAHPGQQFGYIDLSVAHPAVTDADPILKLTIDKYNVVHQLQKTLKTEENPATKLSAFRAALTPERTALLNQRRDTKGMTFWKVIATIFSLGLACAFGLWKPRGSYVSKEFDRIAPQPSPPPVEAVDEKVAAKNESGIYSGLIKFKVPMFDIWSMPGFDVPFSEPDQKEKISNRRIVEL